MIIFLISLNGTFDVTRRHHLAGSADKKFEDPILVINFVDFPLFICPISFAILPVIQDYLC